MKWLRIPEKVMRQALKEHKEKTGNDFSCVWPQDSDMGVYLRDFVNHLTLDYGASYRLLEQLLVPLGYDVTDCDQIFYTPSKFYIVLWNEE